MYGRGISDEIRKVADKYDVTHVTPLYVLADRIDAEMVELPKDADGVPWTSHEEYFWIETIGGESVCHRLRSLALVDGSRWCVEDAEGLMYEAGAAWHERPDGLGRIAREMDEWRFERMRDLDEVDFDDLGLFAERIRKLAKDD